MHSNHQHKNSHITLPLVWAILLLVSALVTTSILSKNHILSHSQNVSTSSPFVYASLGLIDPNGQQQLPAFSSCATNDTYGQFCVSLLDTAYTQDVETNFNGVLSKPYALQSLGSSVGVSCVAGISSAQPFMCVAVTTQYNATTNTNSSILYVADSINSSNNTTTWTNIGSVNIQTTNTPQPTPLGIISFSCYSFGWCVTPYSDGLAVINIALTSTITATTFQIKQQMGIINNNISCSPNTPTNPATTTCVGSDGQSLDYMTITNDTTTTSLQTASFATGIAAISSLSSSASNIGEYNDVGVSCATPSYCVVILGSGVYSNVYSVVFDTSSSGINGFNVPQQIITANPQFIYPGNYNNVDCPAAEQCILTTVHGSTYMMQTTGQFTSASIANSTTNEPPTAATNNSVNQTTACITIGQCYNLLLPSPPGSGAGAYLMSLSYDQTPPAPTINTISEQNGVTVQMIPTAEQIAISSTQSITVYPPVSQYNLTISNNTTGAACDTYAAPGPGPTYTDSVTLSPTAPSYTFGGLWPTTTCQLSGTTTIFEPPASSVPPTSPPDVQDVTISSTGQNTQFVPLNPVRICDTRAVGNSTYANPCNQQTNGNPYALNTTPLSINVPTAINNYYAAISTTEPASQIVPSGALAVSVNITITGFTCSAAPCWGFLNTAATSAAVLSTTAASTINWAGNLSVVTNAATIPLDGSDTFYIGSPYPLNNDTTNIIIDINGYYIPSTSLNGSSGNLAGLYNYGASTPGTPQRICDTRIGVPPTECNPLATASGTTYDDTALTVGTPLVLNLTNYLPSTVLSAGDVSAAELSVQALNAIGENMYIVIDGGTSIPYNDNTSYLNPQMGQAIASRVIVPVSSNSITLTLEGSANGSSVVPYTDLVIDLDGYFTAGTTSQFGGYYNPVPTPFRVIDTRSCSTCSSGASYAYPNSTLGANTWTAFTIANNTPVTYGGTMEANYLPSTASYIMANTTVVNTTAWGYDSILPIPSTSASPPTPTISTGVPSTSDTLWQQGGEAVAELDIVGLNNNGIEIYNGSSGTVDTIVDIYGWYTI